MPATGVREIVNGEPQGRALKRPSPKGEATAQVAVNLSCCAKVK